MEKKNNKLVVFLLVVIICLVVGGGFALYKVLSDTSNSNLGGSSNNNQHLSGDNKYDTWFEYLLDTEINSIEITSCNGIKETTTTITTSELKSIFNEMKKGTLVKDFDGGLGGVCMESININYTSNGTNYDLDLVNNEYIDLEYLKDATILSYLENSNYTISNNSSSDVAQGFIYNYDQTVVKNTLNNNENEETPEWVNYLAGFDLVLTESVYDHNKNECVNEKVSISQSDLKKVLAELSTKKLYKNYYGSMPPVGSACNGLFRLTYGKNSIQFQIEGSFWSNDKVLDSKLDLDLDDTWYNDDYKQFDGYAYAFRTFEEGELTKIVNKYRTNK